MMRVKINVGKVGLVFRNGDYNRVLTEGTYWLFPFEEVKIYDRSKPFHPPVALDVLLKDPKLAEMLTVVEVKDNEIMLQFENGNFKNVLTAGRYALWRGGLSYTTHICPRKPEILGQADKTILQKRGGGLTC